MTSDLFTLPETPSPRLAWMRRHGIETATDLIEWIAWQPCAGEPDVEATGPTEDDAICELAKKLGLRLWNEE